MKRMKHITAVFILAASVMLTACGTEKKPGREAGTGTEEKTGRGGETRTELTEGEMKSGHASFRMAENLVVDADVTKKEKYDREFSSYYLKPFCETDKESEKKFLKAPTVSLHSFKEWEGMLGGLVPGKFRDGAFRLNRSRTDIRQEYEAEDGGSYRFHAGWSNHTRGVEEQTGFNGLWVYFDDGGGNRMMNTALEVRKSVRDYHGSGKPAFLTDMEGTAEQVKKFLQEMSGRPICAEYDYAVVSRETIGMLNQTPFWSEDPKEEPEEEYAALYFHYDIEGLPFKEEFLNHTPDGDAEVDELCYWSVSPGSSLLVGVSEDTQVALVSGRGIIGLECSNMWHPQEVYKEKLRIADPNAALKQVKEFYDRQVMRGECVVRDIELLYTGYFSDSADGKVRPVAAPFWKVSVYDGGAGQVTEFVYDACTGECIAEGVQR